jgi:hypothetical protein
LNSFSIITVDGQSQSLSLLWTTRLSTILIEYKSYAQMRCQAIVFTTVEEFFAELKAFVRLNWQKHTAQDFMDFLEWSLDVVGAKGESAEGHFRHANVEVEEQWKYMCYILPSTASFELVSTKTTVALQVSLSRCNS